jgi:hypothetical protein
MEAGCHTTCGYYTFQNEQAPVLYSLSTSIGLIMALMESIPVVPIQNSIRARNNEFKLDSPLLLCAIHQSKSANDNIFLSFCLGFLKPRIQQDRKPLSSEAVGNTKSHLIYATIETF